MAKAAEGDAWTTIATVTNDERLPAGHDRPYNDRIQKRVEYPFDVTGKTWQYFRLEILNTLNLLDLDDPAGYVQLSEFDFGKNY